MQATTQASLAPGRWVSIAETAARRHPLFGVRGLLIAILLGYAWCAGTSGYRLFLLAAGVLGWRGELPAHEAVLTFMPVADLAFVVTFVLLLVQSLRPFRPTVPENGTILCGLYVLYVVPYVFAFRHLTKTAAFSLDAPGTWIHYILPVLFCLAAIGYLVRSRRVQVTYRASVRRDDPLAGRGRA